MANTGELIASLKKVFTNAELKVIVECLQKLKKAKDRVDDISGVLASLKQAIFKQQTNPRETDKAFVGKHQCLEKLAGFIPPKFRSEFDAFFLPLIQGSAFNN